MTTVHDQLTAREKQVMVAAAHGDTIPETAQRLHLSIDTIRSYRKRALAKLGARSMTQAVAIGLIEGHIE